jgi:RNA polymerase sigma-70 factor (ECF subfamily)
MNDPRQEYFLEATLGHLDAVYSVARRLAHDPGQVEDLVQETYLNAWRAFSGYRGGNMRAWMMTICLNAARSDARRRGRRPREVPEETLPVELEMEPDDTMTSCVDRLTVIGALKRLSEAQRICVVLVDLGGLSPQLAADVLGCPRGTVLARVHRGRRRLAQLIERERAGHEV